MLCASCTAMGTTTYTAKITLGGIEYTDTKDVTDIPAKGHSYEAIFNWDGFKCSASLYCDECKDPCFLSEPRMRYHIVLSASRLLRTAGAATALTLKARCDSG